MRASSDQEPGRQQWPDGVARASQLESKAHLGHAPQNVAVRHERHAQCDVGPTRQLHVDAGPHGNGKPPHPLGGQFGSEIPHQGRGVVRHLGFRDLLLLHGVFLADHADPSNAASNPGSNRVGVPVERGVVEHRTEHPHSGIVGEGAVVKFGVSPHDHQVHAQSFVESLGHAEAHARSCVYAVRLGRASHPFKPWLVALGQTCSGQEKGAEGEAWFGPTGWETWNQHDRGLSLPLRDLA